jgi:hypothetical protein
LRIGDSIAFNDPENWYLNLIAENEGSESHRACIPIAGYLWMTGRKGVSLFNGTGVSEGVQNTASGGIITSKISDPIATLFEFSDPSSVRLSSAIEWKNRIYLCVDRTGTQSGGLEVAAHDTTLIYDYMRVGEADPRKGAWSKFDGIAASQFVVHEDKLLGTSPAHTGANKMPTGYAVGTIFQWDNGNHADKADLSSASNLTPTYRMTAIRGKNAHVYNDKDFRFVNVWASGVGLLTVKIRVNGLDYDSATQAHTENITLTTAGEKTKISLPSGTTGKHLWIQFEMSPTTSDGGTTFSADLTISKVQVFYNLRGLRNA